MKKLASSVFALITLTCASASASLIMDTVTFEGPGDPLSSAVVGAGIEFSNTFSSGVSFGVLAIDLDASSVVISYPGSVPLFFVDAFAPFTGTLGSLNWFGDPTGFIDSIAVATSGITGGPPIVTHGPNSLFIDVAGGFGEITQWDPGAELTITITPSHEVAPIPEPSTIAIWSVLGLVGAGVRLRRKRKAA